MKRSFRKLIPVFIALVLLVTLPLSGCSKIIGAMDRVADKVRDKLQDVVENVLADSTVPPQGSTPRPSESNLETARPASVDGAADLIPLDEIFAPAEYTDPVLSTDGKLALYRHILPDGRGDSVVVMDIESGVEKPVPYPEGANGIPYFDWAGDGRHVLFMIYNSGDENYSLYSVNIETGESVTLYKENGATAYIVALDERNANGVFFQANGRNGQVFDLYWCDITSGETELIMENPGYVSAWYLDRDSYCRIVKTNDEDGGESLLYKTSAGSDSAAFIQSDWKEVLHWDYEDVENSGFYGFSIDGKRIHYGDSTGRNTAAIMEMDLATGETKSIDSDPVYDAASTWIDLKKDRVTAVRYVKERSEWKALEPEIGAQLEYVGTLANGDFGFASTSKDDKYWLVWFENDTEGRSWYYVDIENRESKYLFHQTPQLKKYEFAPMEPISYTASDGLTIHGYATFPVGSDRKNLPMVLYVHGGPKYRDSWGFNGEVQWLANRGYLVVQVNFRGSTGYGKEFVKAGDREWGGKMQQDLTDAVDWAVNQGFADRKRVAIMGASYGGYAALAGAAFTPDVYACAVDMFGPSSLITLVENSPTYWKPELAQLYQSIGDPAKDGEFMKSRSPLYYAENIRIPVLIAQGGNDVRVTPQESEQMVAAMKEKKLDVKYMYFPNAGHGFNSTEDYLEFFTELESFLARHIGGRTE